MIWKVSEFFSGFPGWRGAFTSRQSFCTLYCFRCLRMNRVRLQDPVLQHACKQSSVRYEDLGLPQEMTVWVDPGEVSCRSAWTLWGKIIRLLGGLCHGHLCRYGEHSTPFSVSLVNGCRRGDGEFSRRIHDAVERASLEVQSGSSSDEDEEGSGADSSVSTSSMSLCAIPSQQSNPEPKTIPTVSNPNSVYRVGWRQNVTMFEILKLGSFKFLLFLTVQRVFSRCSSNLAEGEAEGLRWRSVPTSRSLSRRSKLSVFEPEELQFLSAHFHLHGASGGQVPLG